MDAKTLALYLGCDVIIEAGSYTGVHEHSIHVGDIKKLTPQLLDYVSLKIVVVKPLLRPLSSMTEEEAKEYAGTFFKDYDSSLTKFYNLGHSIAIRYYDAFLHLPGSYEPNQFQYLLSKGFDLFGLIEKGEAIDSTKG